MATTVSKCQRTPCALVGRWKTSCHSGSVTHHAILSGRHSYLRIQPASSAIKIAHRCGVTVAMGISAPHLEIYTDEALAIIASLELVNLAATAMPHQIILQYIIQN